ncbi:hypothetical protein ALP89_101590 [Pseudomonas syringae pv. persicae]|nr:hypothetical protein ALP89_101590 [Pseudomonas syringae pv. persicae]
MAGFFVLADPRHVLAEVRVDSRRLSARGDSDQPTNCDPQYGEIVPSKPTAIANNKKPINESPSLPMSVSC